MGSRKLQISPSLVDDVESVAECIDAQSLVWLVYSFDKLKRDGVLDVPTEICQEEQTFLNNPNVGIL